MKQIINNLLYDTDDATQVCEGGNGLSMADFNCVDKSLYRTDSGLWFVRTYLGAAASGSGSCERFLVEYTEDEAYEFMVANASVDKTIEFFGDRVKKA